MDFPDWEPIYEEILSDMGYSREDAIDGYSTSYAGTTDVVVDVEGAAADAEITVTVGDKTATVTADAQGKATVTVEGVSFVEEEGNLVE